MPEIPIIPGLRDVGQGPSEQAHQQLKDLRQSSKVHIWNHEGTEAECEASWQAFLLAGTPDWIIYS